MNFKFNAKYMKKYTLKKMDKYIENNTEFIIKQINYFNIYENDDKRYLTKIFLDIYENDNKCELVTIESKFEHNNTLSKYDNYYLLSNDVKVIINQYHHLEDYYCEILDDNFCKLSNNYFIMEKEKFISKYTEFEIKLNKLFGYGYRLNQIKFLFEEFTKDKINIL